MRPIDLLYQPYMSVYNTVVMGVMVHLHCFLFCHCQSLSLISLKVMKTLPWNIFDVHNIFDVVSSFTTIEVYPTRIVKKVH